MDGTAPLLAPDLLASDQFARTSWSRAPSVARPSRFLQRDLSETALRQPAEPLFSAAELAASREDGFEAGREAGLAHAATTHAAAEAAALTAIAAALAQGQADAAIVANQAGIALARALLAGMQAVMPELIRRSALDEAGAMLARILPGLSCEPLVHVHVPSAIASGVSAAVRRLTPDHAGRVDVTAAHDLEPGAVRIAWSGGRAIRRPAQVWQSVMDAFEPLLNEEAAKDTDNGE